MDELNLLLQSMFPAVDFQKEYKLVENRLLDSLDLSRLIPALEQKYGVRIPIAEISAENFNSGESMFSLMRKLSGKG